MKCTNCGAELPEGSTVCFECGAPQQAPSTTTTPNTTTQSPATNNVYAPEKGKNKCKNCGADLPDGATVCFECGSPQNVVKSDNGTVTAQVPATGTTKSKVLAAILAFFFGCYGIDQFYLGFVKTGIIRIVVTFVTCSIGGVIWGIVDCVRIATGSIKVDAKGNPII